MFVRGPRAAPSTVAGRGHLRGRGGRAQSRARTDPCAAAAAHGGVGDAAGQATLPEVRAGAASPPRREHRDLREGRPRCAQADRASVAGSGPMSSMRESLAEYLAVRRALGYKLEGTERLLRRSTISTQRAPTGSPSRTRLSGRRSRGPASTGTRCGWERSAGLLATCAKSTRESRCRRRTCCPTGRAAVPYLYTDEQILGLIEAASTLRSAHKTATFRTLFGLLIVTGMRIGRRSRRLAPTSTPAWTLIVRHGKFGESRAAAAPDNDQRADALPRSPGPPPASWSDRGAADLDRRHPAVHQRRGDCLPGVASLRDPAALGCVPAADA